MKAYNGHRSWNTWNVSLWISNDEPTYRYAMNCLVKYNNDIIKATRAFMSLFCGDRTPDGAKYNYLSVKLCLQNFIENLLNKAKRLNR